MKTFTNNFTYGRNLLKQIIIGAIVTTVMTFIFRANPTWSAVFSALTIGLFIASVVVVVKYCRCPHCNRVIFLGVMALNACPTCKRSLLTGKKIKKSR